MTFSALHPETAALVTRALHDACEQLRDRGQTIDNATRAMLSIRIMAGIVAGERDPDHLTRLAVECVDEQPA